MKYEPSQAGPGSDAPVVAQENKSGGSKWTGE